MKSAFEELQSQLKQLPGLGYRSAERLALHLLVERPERSESLIQALQEARARLRRCPVTGNMTEGERCPIYEDPARDRSQVCLVEQVTDLLAFEKSGAYRGVYHVLFGKLSPIHGVGPDDLNLDALKRRLREEAIQEIILALPNDIEGEATCHYIRETLVAASEKEIRVTRIGFGLPSGGGVTYADAVTLKSALDGRRDVTG